MARTYTQGERVFADYLTRHKVPYEDEPPTPDGKIPDFLLLTEPRVYCEVKDFARSGLDELPLRVGSRSLLTDLKRIREAIHKKADQVSSVKGAPCVLVLYNAGSMINLLDFVVAGAMFGDPMFSVSLRDDESRLVFGGGAELGPAKNTSLTAVVVLEQRMAGQAELEKLGGPIPTGAGALDRRSRIAQALEETMAYLDDHPEALELVPFVTVYESPFAAATSGLPEGLFTGPHDRRVTFRLPPAL